ncbi:MAG TPA: M3 family metallopeptidase, partial [Bacillota bacterium]|nr:M3 family metallopeptidase [Bacillota bacterium]
METTQGKLPKREDIPREFRWKREDLYSGQDKWEEDHQKVKGLLPELQGFQGKLGADAASLLKGLQQRDRTSQLVEKMFVYAKMGKDEDTTNAEYQALTDKAMSLSVEAEAALAFVVPEILEIPQDRLNSFLEEEKGLEPYRFFLKELLRQKEHILSAREEELLAQTGEVAQSASSIFGMLTNADLKFPSITDEQGREVELTKGRYVQFMESQDRKVRKQAFDTLYATYGGLKNTLAASLNASVKTDIFYSRVRKYNSALEGALDSDNIQIEVYDNLIKTVRENLQPMYKYVSLRRKALKLEELHMYDLYAPMVPDVKMKVEYSE